MGIRVGFPGRRVIGMHVTGFSHPYIREYFVNGPGFTHGDGHVELPKVELERGAHYQVLVLLDRAEGFMEPMFPDPRVVAGIAGGVRGRAVWESRAGPRRRVGSWPWLPFSSPSS
ncbi:hypothetical protein [Streptomyces sp. NPDC017890]|uniref:hypothetical protein n=1 Tax=Streptomyces sp. NPDC017890 TaxID=3365015 RepID=UPI0037AF4A0D